MNIDACYQLGYVIKKHGSQGAVSIFLDVDSPEEYSELESVFVQIDQKLVPFFVEYIQIRGDKAVIKFEDIDDAPAAEQLKSKGLYLPLSALPELDEGQFYYHEIEGYQVLDEQLGAIGTATTVVTTAMQDLLVVDHKGTEVLVPINDEVVIRADHENRSLHIHMPDGLLDIYLES